MLTQSSCYTSQPKHLQRTRGKPSKTPPMKEGGEAEQAPIFISQQPTIMLVGELLHLWTSHWQKDHGQLGVRTFIWPGPDLTTNVE